MDTTMDLAGFPNENTKTVAARVRDNPGGPALRALIVTCALAYWYLRRQERRYPLEEA